jgi:uncharacterized protein YnzC (UPF0291/DUF896 family)
MIDENIVKRINELARKAKSVGLSEDEIKEREGLRQRYLQGFRASLKAQLETIEFVDDDPNTKGMKH